ncbi:MAG: biotin/lipoyl-containing protein [Candidatus Zixiibacteriota bacterium]
MIYIVTINDKEFEVAIADAGDLLAISINGKSVDTSVVSGKNEHHFLMLLNSKSYDAEVFRDNGNTCVFLHGREFDCMVEDQRLVAIRRAAGLRADSGKRELHAPMPGLVMRILKSVGDSVKKGEPLLVVEAMKMENELKSPCDGVVQDIQAVVGKAVDKGAVLVIFA